MQRNAVSKTIVVTPLVAIMKDQVEQLQSTGIRALAIGVDEEEDEEGAGKWISWIVYESPESLLSKEWRKEQQQTYRSHRNR